MTTPAALHDQLHNEATRAKEADRLRSLVSRIELVPNNDELVIVLRGDLAAILTFASGKKNPAFLAEKALLDALLSHVKEGQKAKKPFVKKGLVQSQGSLVAGAGFEPAAFRL